MTSRQDDARLTALVLPGEAPSLEGLATALREDLLEALQFMRLKVQTGGELTGTALVTFDDVPGLPMEALEGAADALEECPVVVGPCADDSVYLLGVNEDVSSVYRGRLIEAAQKSLDELAGALEEAGLEAVTMPPWFRVRSAKDLTFAGALARLSSLSEDGDMGFLADRLKLWLSRRTEE